MSLQLHDVVYFGSSVEASYGHLFWRDSLLYVIFIVFPNGFINFSKGLDCGCNGGVFSRLMSLFCANCSIVFQLNGGPLSDSWFPGLL